MSENNKRVALDFVAAMDIGDGAAMDRCLAPDAFTMTMGFAGVSGRRSRDTMIATANAFKHIVPTGFRPEIRKVVAEGDTVVVEFIGNSVLSNGEAYCNEYAFIFTLRDSKIIELHEYLCTALADRVILPLLAEADQRFAGGDAR